MRQSAAWVCSVALAAALPLPVLAAEPVLQRVSLSSGGVGEFAYDAEVAGADTVRLTVPLDQVDDVLKTLRVADPAGPPVSVRLPGQSPLSETFRGLPFSQEQLGAPDTLLAGLAGAEVKLPASGITGTILGVSAFDQVLPGGAGTITRHRLSIATATGIDSAVLEDTAQVELLSPELRGQLAQALAAIAKSHGKDSRTVEIKLADGGARHVGLAVVVAVPVWKASYRLVTDQAGSTARLEGWAVVENLSGQAWHDVDVTLTSGQPVLYHQALYDPLFVTRPEAPVGGEAMAPPPVDAGAMPVAAAAPAPPPPQMAPRMAFGKSAVPEAEKPSAVAEQGTAQVLFHLAKPVSAEPGQTLLLPVIADDLPAAQVAWYQPQVDAVHPLVAVKLTNPAKTALPPGLVTLYEKDAGGVSFVGDARLPAMAAGESRMASFAADLPVRIEMENAPTSSITGVTVANGEMRETIRDRQTITYHVATPESGGRRLVVEIPRTQGFTLAAPKDGVELTPDAWRVRFDAQAGKTSAFTAITERVRLDRVLLGQVQPDMLVSLAANAEIPPALRETLKHAASLWQGVAQLTAQVQDNAAKQTAIVTDQARLRENLKAVPANSELQRGYLAQMQAGETQLAALRAEAAKLADSANAAKAAYRDAVAAISF